MPVFQLIDKVVFPPVELAEPDGLLAVGGDLAIERILEAYRSGIFPWYSGEEILWWSPDPRFVLYPSEILISKSMKKVIRDQQFRFAIDTDFKQVIANCKSSPRQGQDGTWITDEMEQSYTELHQAGIAHSAEAWVGDELVGGLYGVRLGNVFYGESMFSKLTNASKFAFISYVKMLQAEGVELIDCQVHTQHLESLGARMISRENFLAELNRLL